jgi:hypothetical protein
MKSRQHSREGSSDLSGLLGALPESPFASRRPPDASEFESLDGSGLLSSFHGAGGYGAATGGSSREAVDEASLEGLPFVDDGGFFDDDLANYRGAASLSFVNLVEAAPQLSLFAPAATACGAQRSIEDELLECQSFGQSLRADSSTF